MEIPIVFIHGFGGNPKEYRAIKNYLQNNGFKNFYEFSYKENLGQISLKEIAKRLDIYIKENIDQKNIYIIGISQGGIIARYYINFLLDKEVSKCVTVCSPHKGSLLAYLYNSPCFIDLRPNSNLLNILNKTHKSSTKFYSIFNPIDLMVFPGTSAKFEKAKINKMVISLLHPTTFSNKNTLKFVLDCFR